MNKKVSYNDADVNSSFTILFLVFSVAFGLFFGSMLDETKYTPALVLIFYALLLYFISDFVRQLYKAGQAVFIWVTVFIFLPVAMNFLLNFPFGRIGTIVFISALITATIIDLVYEVLIKRIAPKNFMKGILKIDSAVDKKVIGISDKHFALTEYRGFVFALLLTTVYFSATYLLFHR